MKKSLVKHILFLLGGVAFLIAVWVTAYFCVGNDLLVPSLLDTVKQTGRLMLSSTFWQGFFGTFLRVLIAFILSLILAAAMAVLSYLYPAFKVFIAPTVGVLRSLPVLAVLLIILVWCGGRVAPVVVAFLSLFPMLYTAIFSALCGVDNNLLEMSRAYKVPIKTQIRKLYLPTLAPRMVAECGAGFAFGIKLVVSAEVLARAKNSLGVLMQDAKTYDLPRLFALVITVCIVGFCIESVCAWLSARMQRGRK